MKKAKGSVRIDISRRKGEDWTSNQAELEQEKLQLKRSKSSAEVENFWR